MKLGILPLKSCKFFWCCLCLGLASCGGDTSPADKSIHFYSTQLRNPEFQWHGPTSREDRIPTLHAARAMAYIGDSAVEELVNAIPDNRVEIISIYDALSEIGLPVSDFESEIIDHRSASEIRQWWIANRESSRTIRNLHRKSTGLPSRGSSEGR